MNAMKAAVKGWVLMSLMVGLSGLVHGQLVEYEFTGSLLEGTPGIGTEIYGTVILDVGAIPDNREEMNGGEIADWLDRNFAIDGITNTGVMAGTSFVSGVLGAGETRFSVADLPNSPPGVPLQEEMCMAWSFTPEGVWRLIMLQTTSDTPGDGFATVPVIWDPLAFAGQTLFIHDTSVGGDDGEYGFFQLDSFQPVNMEPPTIIIDGQDTGIADIEYDGMWVSEWLELFAEEADNHGRFIRRVAQLTNELITAGLLTGEEKGIIMALAAQSTGGK